MKSEAQSENIVWHIQIEELLRNSRRTTPEDPLVFEKGRPSSVGVAVPLRLLDADRDGTPRPDRNPRKA